MLKESAIVLSIIILFCILVYLLRETPPFDIIYNYVTPIIQQLQTTVEPLIAPVSGFWDEAQAQVPWVDDAVKMGTTSAVTTAVLRYIGNKTKATLENKISAVKSELDNHTSELGEVKKANETLETQRNEVLTLAGQLGDALDTKDDEITDLKRQLDDAKEETRTAIEERNAATHIDTDKIADEVKEKLSVK